MRRPTSPETGGEIPTVLGAVRAHDLKRVLPHEHIASVYGGWGRLADKPNPEWERIVLEHYTPLLARLAGEFGCNGIVESTPSWECRGPRDYEVLAELSRRSGVHIVVATGYFFTHWFRDRRPDNYRSFTAAQIADGLIRDLTVGIGDSGVRAGLIKVSVGRFDAGDVKLLRAAAIAHRETGAAISTCAGNGRRYLDVLEGAGVPPERILLGHGDAGSTIPELLSLLARGTNAVLTIWGIRNPGLIGWQHAYPPPKQYSAAMAAAIVSEGFEDRLMLSVDYSAMDGFDGGRLLEDLYEVEGRTFLYLFSYALPALRRFGVSDTVIERMLRDNPRRMLSMSSSSRTQRRTPDAIRRTALRLGGRGSKCHHRDEESSREGDR